MLQIRRVLLTLISFLITALTDEILEIV